MQTLNRYTIHEKVNFRSFASEKTKLNIKKLKENYCFMDKYYREAPKGSMPNDNTWTKPKDFIRMALGKYNLTNHNYNYSLDVGKYDSGEKYYRIVVKGAMSGDSIVFLEFKDSYFEETSSDHYRYDKPIVTRLSTMISVGGMTVHSNDSAYNLISDLTILPRGKFNLTK